MLCIPEQLFNSAHTAESESSFQHVLCFIYLSLISEHRVAIFYLHGPIHRIKILIKDNTVIVFIWYYYERQVPNFLRTFELSDRSFLKNLYYFRFLPLSGYSVPVSVSAR